MQNNQQLHIIAPGEYLYIPAAAGASFFRPGFAYTSLCPDQRLRLGRNQRKKEEIKIDKSKSERIKGGKAGNEQSAVYHSV